MTRFYLKENEKSDITRTRKNNLNGADLLSLTKVKAPPKVKALKIETESFMKVFKNNSCCKNDRKVP